MAEKVIIDVEVNEDKAKEARMKERKEKAYRLLVNGLDSSLTGLLIITYIIVSVACPAFLAPSGRNMWSVLWPIIFLGDLPSSIIRSVHKKRFCSFSIWGIPLFLFLFLGMYLDYWHPYWLILLAIPAYYLIFGPIDRYIDYRKEEKE